MATGAQAPDPSPWVPWVQAWTQGTHGLGPGAWAPCGHVFSQERYRNHTILVYFQELCFLLGIFFLQKHTLEKNDDILYVCDSDTKIKDAQRNSE